MTIRATRPFDRDFAQLPDAIKRRAEKQFQLLLTNPHHPSLRIKKMEDPRDIWEGRITQHYRFTFQIVGDTYLLRRIGTHDVLRTNRNFKSLFSRRPPRRTPQPATAPRSRRSRGPQDDRLGKAGGHVRA